MEKKKRKISIPITIWLVVSLLIMFDDVDVGLFVLLIGCVILLLRFAIRKDREFAQRKKRRDRIRQRHEQAAHSTNTESHQQPIQRRPVPQMTIEYVGPQSGETVNVRVAGVTFANGRRQRQTILREIYWHDKEYSGSVHISLKRAEFEGSPCIEVWANNEQIGYIPKSQLNFFLENWDRLKECKGLRVYGGGQNQKGNPISFGASFVAVFE